MEPHVAPGVHRPPFGVLWDGGTTWAPVGPRNAKLLSELEKGFCVLGPKTGPLGLQWGPIGQKNLGDVWVFFLYLYGFVWFF